MSDATVVSPALLIIGGAALVPFLPHLLRNIYMLALPIVAFGFFVVMPQGEFGLVNYLGVGVGPLGLIFGRGSSSISSCWRLYCRSSSLSMSATPCSKLRGWSTQGAPSVPYWPATS